MAASDSGTVNEGPHDVVQSVGPIVIRSLQAADDFETVASSWDSLYARAGCAIPALTSAAVRAFLAHRLTRGETAIVVLAFLGRDLVGALPLVARRHRFGVTLGTFSDHETYGVEFLIDPRAPSSLRWQLVDAAFRQFPRTVSVRLADLRGDSATVAALPEVGALHYRVEENRRASFLPVPTTPDDIPAILSANFRKNLRKQEGRLRALPDVRCTFGQAHATDGDQFEAFVALEASGWKGENGTAIGCREHTLAYYRALTTGLNRAGELEWQMLWAEGRVIGAHLGVRTGPVLSLLKIAYDEAYASCGPGNMLFLEMLRRESALGLSREIDCLTDMAWHTNWRMQSRSYVTVTLYPKTTRALVFGYLPAVAVDTLRKSALLRRVVRVGKQWRKRHTKRPDTAKKESQEFGPTV